MMVVSEPIIIRHPPLLEKGEDIVCIIGNNELYAISTALFGTSMSAQRILEVK
jgi:hypothetical protein